MTNEHPVETLMKSTMENLRDMVDVNTVIGDAVETRDGSYIIPISRVTFGFASGGSEFGESNNNTDSSPQYPFGGGSGAGVSVKPVAFLVVRDDAVRLLPVEQDTTYDRIVDTVPQVIDMVKNLFKKSDNSSCSNRKNTENIMTDEFDSTDCSCHLDK
ncbi:GerW family sporulation protein [Clostridium paraputrificum]|uniref:GerW family sporulation protein n=1 Tax=Clostridium TaxID=1485 RepID=UPI003D34D699